MPCVRAESAALLATSAVAGVFSNIRFYIILYNNLSFSHCSDVFATTYRSVFAPTLAVLRFSCHVKAFC